MKVYTLTVVSGVKIQITLRTVLCSDTDGKQKNTAVFFFFLIALFTVVVSIEKYASKSQKMIYIYTCAHPNCLLINRGNYILVMFWLHLPPLL